MKVAIYCRVSTKEQDVDKQLKICEEYAKLRDMEVISIYKDIYTGKEESRPAFNELLADMRAFKFNAIMVTKLDRIGRSLKHLLTLFEEFKNKQVQFIAVTQNIDTSTSAGKLQMQIIGAFAEYEANIISERTKEGLSRSDKKHLIGKRGKDKKPRKKRGVLRKQVYL